MSRRRRGALCLLKTDGDAVASDSFITPVNAGSEDVRSGAFSNETDACARGDVALRALCCSLQEIFDAESELQRTSHDAFRAMDDDSFRRIHDVQSNVEVQLREVVVLDLLAQVSLEDIVRLQKICEGSLKAAKAVDPEFEDPIEEPLSKVWLRQVTITELQLLSGQISLLVMSGARKEKQLYSETMIQISINVLKKAIEAYVIPAMELQSSTTSSAVRPSSTHKNIVITLMLHCEQLLCLLANLPTRVKLSETVINTIETTAFLSVFADVTPGVALFHREKPKFENLRGVAADLLVQIFLSYPAQRSGIFNEILVSLEKLAATQQASRHVKLDNGGNIQLISALVMRLIQTSMRQSDENCTRQAHMIATQELSAIVSPLLERATKSAAQFVNFLVSRASISAQTPFRNFLALFIEDLVSSLECPEWPAAELLLRLLLFKMVQLAEENQTVPWVKTMALESLGSIGVAILGLSSSAPPTIISDEVQANHDCSPGVLRYSSLEVNANLEDLIAWEGPFRTCLEYLNRGAKKNPQLSSAFGYLATQWAFKVHTIYNSTNSGAKHYKEIERRYGPLASRLGKLIAEGGWMPGPHDLVCVAQENARSAYNSILLHSQFYDSFERVLDIILASMASGHASIRCKSVRIVSGMLEAEPRILDHRHTLKALILRSANDSSVSVRDAALNLMGKCVELRPALEVEMLSSILEHVNDVGISVRKHAMKLSKQIYLQGAQRKVRRRIAEALLYRLVDAEASIRVLAVQTIEEIWMWPIYQPTSCKASSTQLQLTLADQVALIVQTLWRSGGTSTFFGEFLQNLLSNSKHAAENFEVCAALVATMFEVTIGRFPLKDDTPSAEATLEILMLFAGSVAQVFTAEQLPLLKPYISNIGDANNIRAYPCAVAILRHVLPHVRNIQHEFLISVRNNFMRQLPRLSRQLLDEVAPCLWIVSKILHDINPLVRLTISSMVNIQEIQGVDLNDPAQQVVARRLAKLLVIAGMFGKHCDFSSQLKSFRKSIAFSKSDSIPEMMVSNFALFASVRQPIGVRRAAFDAIGLVCQSWPKNFTLVAVYTRLEEAFNQKNSTIVVTILRSILIFLVDEERRSDVSSCNISTGLISDGENQHDGVAAFITQKFMGNRKDLLHIALATQDNQALLATDVLASMNRQGLLHPKECAPMWIALETSQNTKIAASAFSIHQILHRKHEAIIEKEYMKAVRIAYEYQRDVIQDTRGATIEPYTSKLHMMIKVMRDSPVKHRIRFYESLCGQIDFDLAKLHEQNLSEYIQHAYFIIENIAFFDYASVEELNSAIRAMEKIFSRAGNIVAHIIDEEFRHLSIDHVPSAEGESCQSPPTASAVDLVRLRIVSAGSIILSSLWDARTFLHQHHNSPPAPCDSIGKVDSEDMKKVSIDIRYNNGDAFWENNELSMAAMDSKESMLAKCRAFADSFNIDIDSCRVIEAIPCGNEDEKPVGKGKKRRAAGIPRNLKNGTRPPPKAHLRKKKRAGIHDENEEWTGYK